MFSFVLKANWCYKNQFCWYHCWAIIIVLLFLLSPPAWPHSENMHLCANFSNSTVKFFLQFCIILEINKPLLHFILSFLEVISVKYLKCKLIVLLDILLTVDIMLRGTSATFYYPTLSFTTITPTALSENCHIALLQKSANKKIINKILTV